MRNAISDVDTASTIGNKMVVEIQNDHFIIGQLLSNRLIDRVKNVASRVPNESILMTEFSIISDNPKKDFIQAANEWIEEIQKILDSIRE